jgi:hypothetical protein
MLARVLSAAVNGIEALPVELDVNSGWGRRSKEIRFKSTIAFF